MEEELENFKRKLIRSVSRLRLVRELPYEQVWEHLNKQTGRDCEALWERMRSITLKKLSRLLAADDRRCNVGPAARMNTTDWLLFDLVLVHDAPDVIGTADTANGDANGEGEGVELPANLRLYQLIVKQEIETCPINTRTRRWEILTKAYNIQGRECSPMLLQLRWYQLKERARNFFYDFWQAFRGNKSNLQKRDRPPPPKPLDIEIARCYSNLVTEPFPSWSDLVQDKTVIQPEMFCKYARKMRLPRPVYRSNMLVTRASLKPQPSAHDAEPDIVLVEPQIDTITLDDSDTETTDNQPSPTTVNQQDAVSEQANNEELQHSEVNAALDGIMEGLQEDGLSNVQILEATHVPTEEIDDEAPLEPIEEEIESPDFKTDEANSPYIPGLVDEVLKEKLNAIEAATQERENADSPELPELADEVLKETLDTIREYTQKPVHEIESDENDTLFTNKVTPKPNIQDLVSKIKEELGENTEQKEMNNDMAEDTSTLVIGELPSNLEFIDDGIDFIEDSEDDVGENRPETAGTLVNIKTEVNQEAEEIEREPQEEEQTKFDLKLMMLPVVYTMKIDYMKCLKQTDHETIDTTAIIDTIIEESKPISALSVKIKYDVDIETLQEEAPDKNTSADLIQMLKPTDGNDLVAHEKNDSGDLIKFTENVLEKAVEALIKSELTEETESVKQEVESVDSSDEDIPEIKRYKLTSSLFKKPKGRTYNPIQLCKNPDFNTRLRRISAGFLSYERNRRYLNRIQPLTIDLHKSFESHLIDKTIYLVPDPNAPKPVLNKQNNSVMTSVVPTALPVQCLLDNTTNIRRSEGVNPIDEELAQRKNKVIELPDIVKVRRINQHLLTAEVSPIQVRNEVTQPVLEISPMEKYNSAATEPKMSKDPRSDLQLPPVGHESPLHDNHPLLEAPKEGEITTVKVELCDDNDEEENFQQPGKSVPPAQDTRRVPPAQDTRRIPPVQDTRRNQTAVAPAPANSAAEKRKEARKQLKEPTKRPWYLPNTPTVGLRLEAKVPKDPSKTPWYKQNPFKEIKTSLLTKDALVRMLLIIDGKDKDGENKKKTKKKSTDTSSNALVSETSVDLSVTEEFTATKEDVKGVENAVKDLAVQKTCKTRVHTSNRASNYCCWARRVIIIATRRQKGSKKTWVPKHKCNLGMCICCCKDELEQESTKLKLQQLLYPQEPETCCWASKMIKIFKERKKYECIRWMPVHNCLLDGQKICKCCCKQALDTVAGVVEQICERVKKSDYIKETTKAVHVINKPSEQTAIRSEPAASIVNDGVVPYENILSSYLDIRSACTDVALERELLKSKNSAEKSFEIDSNSNGSHSDRGHDARGVGTSSQVTPQGTLVQKKSYTVRVANIQKLKSVGSQSVSTSTEPEQFIELSDDEADSAQTNNVGQSPYKNRERPARITVSAGNIKPVVTPRVMKTMIAPKPKFIIKCFKHLIRACPVRLGPDKILLTTCHLPADLIMPQPSAQALSPGLQPSGLMTNVLLPKGVHLVLDPSGKLACAFEPNVNLDEQALLELKNVVAEIQDQLNKKLPLPAQSDNAAAEAPIVKDVVTLLSDDERSDDKPAETETCENQEQVQTSTEPSSLVDENKHENALNTQECSVVAAQTDNVETNTVSKDAECTSQTADALKSVTEGDKQVGVDDVVTDPEPLAEVNENITTNTSENIDFIQHMEAGSASSSIQQYTEENKPNEQSPRSEGNSQDLDCQVESLAGNIPSEEIPASDVNVQPPLDIVTTTETATPDDTAAMTLDESSGVANENDQEERETVQPSMSNKKSILSDLMEMSGISSEDILAPEPPVALAMPEPPVAIPTPVVVSSAPAADGPIELTQVTNVAALKYAVAQNAKFYRYTLGTGALAAIEVALQTRQNPSPPEKQLIDLTDPSDNNTPEPPKGKARGPVPIVLRKVSSSKPPPIITITPPTTSKHHRSLLKRPVSTISIESKEHKRKRKQLVDPTIYNLDATDGEMEEEYLLESEEEDESDPRKTISFLKSLLAKARAKRAAKEAALAANDSSDDEPLAKKVKRKRKAKKLKKKFKEAKRQLMLIQKAAGTYSIVSETGPPPEDGTENYSIVPVDAEVVETAGGTSNVLPTEPAIFTKTSVDALPAEEIPENVAAKLANEGEVWLEQSDNESDNFILGA